MLCKDSKCIALHKTFMTKKTQKNIRLSDDAKKLLEMLCEKQQRSDSNMIEHLIREAAKKEKLKIE